MSGSAVSWAALRERQSICKTPTGSGEARAVAAGTVEEDAAAGDGAAVDGDPQSGRAAKGVDGAGGVAAPSEAARRAGPARRAGRRTGPSEDDAAAEEDAAVQTRTRMPVGQPQVLLAPASPPRRARPHAAWAAAGAPHGPRVGRLTNPPDSKRMPAASSGGSERDGSSSKPPLLHARRRDLLQPVPVAALPKAAD